MKEEASRPDRDAAPASETPLTALGKDVLEGLGCVVLILVVLGVVGLVLYFGAISGRRLV